MIIKNIDKFLEESFIPCHVICKKIEYSNGDIEYKEFIPLYDIVKLKLSPDQKQYITSYLKNKNIKVIGYSDMVDFESDDYLYTRNYRGRTPKSISKEETDKKLELYSKTKDLNLRNEIVVGNMRLINYAINNMNSEYYANIYDMEQAGYIGLIKAVENYNSSKGAFSTFALSYIIGHIKFQLYLLNGVKNSEYPFYTVGKEIEKEYDEKICNNPFLAEIIVDRLIASGFRNEINKEQNIRRVMLMNSSSLDETFENDEEKPVYNLGYEIDDNCFNEVYDAELQKLIAKKMSLLSEKQRLLLQMRFGFINDKEYKLREIAEELGISIAAVAACIDRILEKLSNDEDIKGLKYYLHREVR